jgi:hypothetical protein
MEGNGLARTAARSPVRSLPTLKERGASEILPLVRYNYLIRYPGSQGLFLSYRLDFHLVWVIFSLEICV